MQGLHAVQRVVYEGASIESEGAATTAAFGGTIYYEEEVCCSVCGGSLRGPVGLPDNVRCSIYKSARPSLL